MIMHTKPRNREFNFDGFKNSDSSNDVFFVNALFVNIMIRFTHKSMMSNRIGDGRFLKNLPREKLGYSWEETRRCQKKAT